MATSGSVDWTATRNQIIRQAALEVQAISAGVTMGAQMLADFDFKLNGMVKAWQATGIHVWTTTEATLFPVAGQVKYALGPGSSDRAVEEIGSTELSADEASGQTVLSVDSITGISASDHVAIQLDDGTLQWTTISGAPAGSTITVADALTDSAAEGNPVYFYTGSVIGRPLKIVDARRYHVISGNETPIRMISRLDYQALPQKTQEGMVNQAFYDPQLGTGYLYLWQAPADVSELIKFTWHRPLQDFDAAGDNPDLPQEWVLAIVFNLAETMLGQFPVSDRVANRIVGLASKYLDLAMGYDREEGSVFFGVNMDGR